MARTQGARNADYDERRAELARAVAAVLIEPGGPGLSFRKLAEAVEVTPPTLRHYFGDHAGTVGAAMAELHAQGLRYLNQVATAELGPAEVALPLLLRLIVEGWKNGVSGVHALGFQAAFGESELGKRYLNELLEPTIRALESRLALHAARGELDLRDARVSALSLLSPLLVALLHQDWLGGCDTRPLEMEPFLAEHARQFLKAHAPEER